MLFCIPSRPVPDYSLKRLENPQVGLRVRRPRQKPYFSVSLFHSQCLSIVSLMLSISHSHTHTHAHTAEIATFPLSGQAVLCLPAFCRIFFSLSLFHSFSLSHSRKNSSFIRFVTPSHCCIHFRARNSCSERGLGLGPIYRSLAQHGKPFAFSHPIFHFADATTC